MTARVLRLPAPIPTETGRLAVGFWPAAMVDVEVSTPLQPLAQQTPGGELIAEARVLVRVFDEPVGLVRVPLNGAPVPSDRLAELIRMQCGEVVADRVRRAGGDVRSALGGLGAGERLHLQPDFLADHARWSRDGPQITVVICTRDRALEVSRALESLRRQSYPAFRVVVCDNAPRDDSTRRVVEQEPMGARVVYVAEERPGLSRARNRALAVVETEVVAWLDDDEVADRHWLMELAAGFCLVPDAAAVSGSVIPAELRTWPQVWFEDYGGHTKGRGFMADVFRATDGRQSPFYPLPPFGVGANMAFRVEALRALGGFDPALGAGTRSEGGEDTLVFTELLLDGHAVAYRPTALTRHYHRPGYDELQRQMRGYGIGLTAYYTSLLCRRPQTAGALLRLIPRALRDMLAGGGEVRLGLDDTFPRDLLARKSRAMLMGPLRYAAARVVAGRPVRRRHLPLGENMLRGDR